MSDRGYHSKEQHSVTVQGHGEHSMTNDLNPGGGTEKRSVAFTLGLE